MTNVKRSGYFESIYKKWNILLGREEPLEEQKKCGCGEPLFLHTSGALECPACEQF